MARQPKLKVGDLVVLKSGGPVMAVNHDSGDGIFVCTWFSGKKNESARFHEDTLNPAPTEAAKS